MSLPVSDNIIDGFFPCCTPHCGNGYELNKNNKKASVWTCELCKVEQITPVVVEELTDDIAYGSLTRERLDDGFYVFEYMWANHGDRRVFSVKNTPKSRTAFRSYIQREMTRRPVFGIYPRRIENKFLEKYLDADDTMYELVYVVPRASDSSDFVEVIESPEHNLQFFDELYYKNWYM